MLLPILSIVKRSIFISVYTVFFIVQVFAGSGKIVTPGSQGNNSAVLHKSGICKQSPEAASTSPDSKKSAVRLNKRFHPESMPGIAYHITTILPLFLGAVNPVKPEDYLLIAPVLTGSLRGPPSVA